MQGWGIIGVAFFYLLLLFAVASIGDRRTSHWNIAPRPYIYALSLAVYCTSWTFSVPWGFPRNAASNSSESI